jgi:hypothetical protein
LGITKKSYLCSRIHFEKINENVQPKENSKRMTVKEFFKKAFSDMKEDAKAQHEVDKANFAAAKAEAKAQFEEAKRTPEEQRQARLQALEEQKAAAKAREEAAKAK